MPYADKIKVSVVRWEQLVDEEQHIDSESRKD